MVGAYGLAAVCADEAGVIAVARKDSPIVVGVGETGSYVASDVIALIDATRDVVVLEDGQFAKLTPAGVEYTDEAGNVIEPKVTHIDWDLDMAEKGGYPDFMLKEIHEQPRVARHAGWSYDAGRRARHRRAGPFARGTQRHRPRLRDRLRHQLSRWPHCQESH